LGQRENYTLILQHLLQRFTKQELGQSLVQVLAVELPLAQQNQYLQKSGILGIKMILVNFMYMMELIG
jgi:hypothetical protein